MNTIAVKGNSFAVNRNNTRKISLKERMKKYFEENAVTIASGLLLMSGNTSAFNLYRSMR